MKLTDPRGSLFLLALLVPAGCGVQELPRPAEVATSSAPTPSSTGAGGNGSGGSSASPDGTPRPDAAATGGAPVNVGAGGVSGAGGASGSGGGPGGQAGNPDASGSAPPDPPTPPASGAGITIGGRFVPKEKALVVLHIGHSNMAGRALGPDDLKPDFYDINPQLWIYGKGGAVRPAQEPTAPDNEAGQAAGPGMALLHAVLSVAAPDTHVLSIGHGHSGSFAGYCSNFRKAGLFYDIVMKPAQELKGKVTFAAIFTMFGQSEHNATATSQKGFADCLIGMAAEMRADLGEPDLPFIMGDYEAGITKAGIEPGSAFAVPIIAQLKTVPDMTGHAAIIPTDGLAMQDDHHYNLAGHKLWAARGIKILIDHGWAPWAIKSP